jgi:hypothetical protein
MRRVTLFTAACLVLGTGLMIAHPHFSKTVTADLQGTVLKLSSTTYPYNEERLAQVQPGFVLHCGRASLTVEGNLTSGGQAIPPGEYAVRARAKSLDDWELLLIPSGDAQNVDLSRAIRLESTTLKGLPEVYHLDLDLYSGHGSTDGKMILAVAFGERRVEGVLGL